MRPTIAERAARIRTYFATDAASSGAFPIAQPLEAAGECSGEFSGEFSGERSGEFSGARSVALPNQSAAPGAARLRVGVLGLLVLQPTAFCNIDCSYCYLPDRSNKLRMSLDTVRAIARFVRSIPAVDGVPLRRSPLTVLWHLGEPMAVPRSFYEEAFAILRGECDVPLQHEFQTNGTLIDDAWCELFEKHGVGIGVSIDGPEKVHDARRRSRSGGGTFARTMRGIDALVRNRIPFGTISVVTAATLDAQDEVCAFLAGLGASSVGLNMEEIEGANRTSSVNDEHAREGLASMLRNLGERSAAAGCSVRELARVESQVMRGAVEGRVTPRETSVPGAILSVDVEGHVSTFSPELVATKDLRYRDFRWANVHVNTWRDMFENPRLLRVYRDIDAGVESCRATCEYFGVCGGGNASNKLSELGSFSGTETWDCKLHVKTVVDTALAHLEAKVAREDSEKQGAVTAAE